MASPFTDTAASTTRPTATRVLVADDQRDVLTALELLFKSEDMSALSVTSPGIETPRLDPGDTLLVFSDGVLEVRGREGEGAELGEDRLVAIARELIATSDAVLGELPEGLLDEIVERRSFRQTDDATILCARARAT